MRMARSSGERTRDVKRRYAIRGGSIPPRAEQQEKSIFCNKHPPRLKRYRPPERRTQGRQIHTGGSERRAKPFFRTAGKTANKRRFTDGLAAGAKRRHSWQAWKASRGCNTPLFVKVSSFPSLLIQIDAKHLAHAPGSIPGLAAIYFKEKGEKECWII